MTIDSQLRQYSGSWKQITPMQCKIKGYLKSAGKRCFKLLVTKTPREKMTVFIALIFKTTWHKKWKIIKLANLSFTLKSKDRWLCFASKKDTDSFQKEATTTHRGCTTIWTPEASLGCSYRLQCGYSIARSMLHIGLVGSLSNINPSPHKILETF